MYLPSGSNMITSSDNMSSADGSGYSSWITTSVIPTITSNLVRTTESSYNQNMQDAISVFCAVLIILMVLLCCSLCCSIQKEKVVYFERRYSDEYD